MSMFTSPHSAELAKDAWFVVVDEPDEYEASELALDDAYRMGRLTLAQEQIDDGKFVWTRVHASEASPMPREDALRAAGKYALMVRETQWPQERDRVFIISADGSDIQRVIAAEDAIPEIGA